MSGAMSRLAVLAAACLVLLPSALHAQANKADSLRRAEMKDRGWDNPRSALWDEEMGSIDEFTDLVNDARWEPDQTCQQHKLNMQKFLVGAVMYWAKDAGGSRNGETISITTGGITEFFVVFNRKLWDKWDKEQMLKTLLHEGWHWAHKETVEGTKAKKAERCAWLPLEEDDDEPGEGGGESTETCEDVWRPALTTTVPVWVVPTDCNDNEDEAETCDFETGICTGMRLHVCPGKWVDQVVVLRDGYMERVCTSN